MAYEDSDWKIDRATGDIRYIGDDHNGAAPSYSTVIEAHRSWQFLAAELVSSGDDEIDIADLNPSVRSTDNIIFLPGNYNIDDNAAEHLYDGSISQDNGNTLYAGIVNKGNSLKIQIIQDGQLLADDWWNSNGGLNPTTGFSHRFMLKVRDGGVDIDGRRLIATSRSFNFTYSEDNIPGAQEGNNVIALSESPDLNNQTNDSIVATWNGIVNTNEGYIGEDVDNNGSSEFYYSMWDINTPTRTMNDFFERSKWLTRDGSSEILYGLPGEVFRGITHEITISILSGSFNEPEEVFWPGGSGQLLAINSPTDDRMYIQLLKGVAPTNAQTITGLVSNALASVSGLVETRTISRPFSGASTGSSIIGAYGLGIQIDDLTNADILFDLDNNPITPPNNVLYSLGGLIPGEDTAVVYPWDGVTIDINGNPAIQKDQLSLQGNLSSNNITSVTVSTPIPTDTPSSGVIRVVDNNGFAKRLEYSSYSVDTFTISSTDGQEDFASVNASSGNNVWIGYIDKVAQSSTESFTVVFSSSRNLVVIVRDGGVTPIKEFITSGLIGPSGGSTTAIRTTDA